MPDRRPVRSAKCAASARIDDDDDEDDVGKTIREADRVVDSAATIFASVRD